MAVMIAHPPDIVKLTFDPNEVEGWYSVVVRDQDGMLLCAGPMKVIHDWLTRHGYSYVEATNGIWRRH